MAQDFSQYLSQMAGGNNSNVVPLSNGGYPRYTGPQLSVMNEKTTGSDLVTGLGPKKTVTTFSPYVAPVKSDYKVPSTPLVLNQEGEKNWNKNGSLVNQSSAPNVDLSNPTSNLKIGASSLDALSKQVSDAIKQVQDAISKQQQDSQAKPQEQSQQNIWDKLFANQQQTQQQITQAESQVPSMDDALNQAMSKFGLTPQSGQQLQTLNTQVNSINQQITDLDNKEANDIQNIQGTGGIDYANLNAKVSQVQRNYSFQRADLVSKGNFALAQASALQGNITQAESFAKDYVSAGTAKEQQTVSDLQWGAQQYSSLLEAMSTSEQKSVNDQISNAIAVAQQAETERHNQVMEMVNGYKAGVPGAGTSALDITIPQGTLASKNNNPGNIKFSNQPGATMGVNGFAKFATPQDGYNAIVNLLNNYMAQNPNITLAQAISTWAPPSENDTQTYIDQVSNQLGVPSNTPLSQLDMSFLSQAIAQKESGTTATPSQTDTQLIAQGIMNGTQPPLSGYGANSASGLKIRAELEKNGYNLTQATEDWNAMQKRISTLNSGQQIKLQQSLSFASDSLGIVSDLSSQWQAGQFPLLNKANLTAAINGAYGQNAASLATRLNTQINDLVSELATVYSGGNTSTDMKLKQASNNLNSNWSNQTLQDAIQLARTNLQIRSNSITSSANIPGNQYSQGGASSGTDYTSILDSILNAQ